MQNKTKQTEPSRGTRQPAQPVARPETRHWGPARYCPAELAELIRPSESTAAAAARQQSRRARADEIQANCVDLQW